MIREGELVPAFESHAIAMCTDGRQLSFRLPGEVPGIVCGECNFTIPLMRMTKQELLVVLEGKQYPVKRSRIFSFKKMDLVDQSFKKILRTWEVPIDSSPSGISPDGTKLYVDLYDEGEGLSDRLLLEVSASGVRFAPRNVLKAQKSREVKKPPINARSTDRMFTRFQVGNKSYIVRYDAPCT